MGERTSRWTQTRLSRCTTRASVRRRRAQTPLPPGQCGRQRMRDARTRHSSNASASERAISALAGRRKVQAGLLGRLGRHADGGHSVGRVDDGERGLTGSSALAFSGRSCCTNRSRRPRSTRYGRRTTIHAIVPGAGFQGAAGPLRARPSLSAPPTACTASRTRSARSSRARVVRLARIHPEER